LPAATTSHLIVECFSRVDKDGQGTRRIELIRRRRHRPSDRGRCLIAGYAPECSNRATAAVKVVGHAIKIDEFGLDRKKE
jgi:hypothetical protein